MGRIIKRHSSFLYWFLVPSLLLVVSVLGVNIVSRPTMSSPGEVCSLDTDCTSFNICTTEFCSLTQNGGFCADLYTTTPNTCLNCGCGDGRCDEKSGEITITCNNSNGTDCTASTSCPSDCAFDGVNFNSTFNACIAIIFQGGIDQLPGPVIPVKKGCSGTFVDHCCPDGCQGATSLDSTSGQPDPTFDVDCCGGLCGDGLIDQSTETCDTGVVNGDGTTAVTALADPNKPIFGSCRTSGSTDPCTYCGDGILQTASGEQCDPPNGTTCDASCHSISQPICGNGIVETGEQCEGTTCSVTLTDGTVVPGVCQNCQCTPQCVIEGSGCGDNANTSAPCVAGTGTTGGASLVPIHPSVLTQWIATFALPGVTFVGLRARRKFKK